MWAAVLLISWTPVKSQMCAALQGSFVPMGQIPRQQGTYEIDFFRNLVAQQTPSVIESGTIVDSWSAMSWDFQSLREETPEIVTGVYVNSQPLFGPLFRTYKPLGSVATIVHRNPHQIQNISADEFFHRVENATNDNGTFVYYTGGLGAKNLSHHLKPLNSLLVGPLEHVNVWLGQANVTTHLHQDTYENFFIQVKGKKSFILCPPDQARSALPFPFLHPSHAQSQLGMDGSDPASNLRCWETLLEPGEILYIPPLFWHHVVTVEPSISINVWTQSKQQEIFDLAIRESVRKFRAEWSTHQKRGVFLGLLTRILDYVYVLDSPPIIVPPGKLFSDLTVWVGAGAANQPLPPGKGVGPGLPFFIKEMLVMRYDRLWRDGELPSIAREGDCPKTISSVLTDPEEIQGLTELAKQLIAMFSTFPLQSRSTWLANYVESLALWAGGSGLGANELFNECCRLL